MLEISIANLTAHAAQILIVVALAAAASRLLDVPVARVRLAYWRAVVILCVALPLLSFVHPSSTKVSTSTPPPSLALAQPASIAETAAEPAAASSGGIYIVGLLLAGIWMRGAWLAVGLARLGRLRRDAVSMDLSEDVIRLRDEIAPHAEIRACGRSAQPATFGVWRPVVLLPETVAALPAQERLAVVCHELLHVRRRDWLWTIAEEALRTAFWFHPAMRYAISRIQASREEVVDAEVVARTGDRRGYMRALLAFAEQPAVVTTAAFVRPRQLSARLRRMTEEIHMSRLRLRMAVTTFTIVLVSAFVLAAGTFRYEVAAQQPADAVPIEAVQFTAPLARAIVRMDRPIYPPDAWRAGIGASVSLVIRVDPNGLVTLEREPSWQITITSTSPVDAVESFWARQGWTDFVNVVTEAIGRWQYVPADSPVTVPMQVTFTPTRVVGPPGIQLFQRSDGGSLVFVGTSGQPPVRVGGAIRPPTKLANALPVYPEVARLARVQGVVIVEALIGTDGAVSVARILRSIPLLDQAALDAVYQWRFTPTLLDGVARDVIMAFTVNFTLPEQQ